MTDQQEVACRKQPLPALRHMGHTCDSPLHAPAGITLHAPAGIRVSIGRSEPE